MIYTVTFNPSLDYIVSVENFQLGLTNRTSSELMLPGGKGVNVSTVLMNLGIENTALGFAAGFVGDEIVRQMEEMGVQNGFIRIEEGVSRINLKLKSIDGTEINGQGPVISPEHVEELMKQLDRLGEGDVLFLSGSIPSSMPDDAYQKIMERLDGRGVQIVVDATKDLLLNVLEYHPFLIKPNNHELGELFGVELKTREEVIPYAKKLQEKAQSMCWFLWLAKGQYLLMQMKTCTWHRHRRERWLMAWAQEILWWQDLWPDGWKSRIMNMHSVWVCLQEAPVHFQNIWQQRLRLKQCISR